MSHGAHDESIETKNYSRQLLQGLLVFIAILYLVWWWRSGDACPNFWGRQNKVPAGYQVVEGECVAGPKPTPSTLPPPPVIPARERPRTPQTFDIPATGLEKCLEEAPAIYPKLGAIRVETPSGRSYTDTPGVDYYPGYEPAGCYKFFPEPAGAKRRVQIYNRW